MVDLFATCIGIVCIVGILILTYYSCKYLEEVKNPSKSTILYIMGSAVISLLLIAMSVIFYSDNLRFARQKAFQEGIEQEWEWKVDTVWTRKKK